MIRAELLSRPIRTGPSRGISAAIHSVSAVPATRTLKSRRGQSTKASEFLPHAEYEIAP